MSITIKDALVSLYPSKTWGWYGGDYPYSGLDWREDSITQPTEDELNTEVVRLQAAYDAQAYARSRKAKYNLLNQDEMRYDDLINSTTTWQDAIAAIKQEYPK
jgi:hypothetical protein